MATCSKKEISTDLINLPPLLDERNALDAYMDVPNNFYSLDGTNTFAKSSIFAVKLLFSVVLWLEFSKISLKFHKFYCQGYFWPGIF